MSEFDVLELGRCWNCGNPMPGSNLPTPRTSLNIKRFGRRPPIHFLWLIFPWLTVLGIMIAATTGVDRWFFDRLPYGLGSTALKNLGWGLLMVFVGSSARWAYLRYSAFGFEKSELHVKVIG